MNITLKFSKRTARGCPCGETHHRARHADRVVEEARALYGHGWSHESIARTLGIARPTVTAWLLGTRRGPHARIVVQRVKHSSADSQSAQNLAPARPSADVRKSVRSHRPETLNSGTKGTP